MSSLQPPMPEPITFAIPFYRGLDYLRCAIASVTRQTSPNWRLLICDDSPNGEAAGVLDRGEPRMRYVHNGGTLGMAANWNRCLDLAETDLVTLLHGDDELLPNYTQVVSEAAVRYPNCAAMFCGAQIIGSDGQAVSSFVDWVKRVLAPAGRSPRYLRGPQAITKLLRVNCIMCPTVCYRKSVIANRRFDPRWRCVLDLDYFTQLLGDGDEIIGLPEVAYAYRRHAENATSSYTESLLKFTEEAALYDEIADEAKARGWSQVARVARSKLTVRLHLLFRFLRDMLGARFSAAFSKLGLLARLSAPRIG